MQKCRSRPSLIGRGQHGWPRPIIPVVSIFRSSTMSARVSELDVCNYAYEGRLKLLILAVDKDPTLVGKRDSNQRTALHWACSSGQSEIAAYLLDKGAEVSFVLQSNHEQY